MGKRYFIESIKCGTTKSGPGEWPTHVSVRFVSDEKTKWLTNSVVTGIPNFYLSDEDIFDTLINNDLSEEFIEKMETLFISEFDGIKLGDFSDIEKELENSKDNDAASLIKYIVDLSTCNDKDMDDLIKAGEGKYIDEIIY